MPHRVAVALALITALSGCARIGLPNSKLDTAADQLVEASSGCLLEVRDGDATYEAAGNCKALSDAATRYIEAGGMHTGESLDNQRKFEAARATAWSAVATSLSRQCADGRGLDEQRAQQVLGYLATLWRRPIDLHTVDGECRALALSTEARAA